MKKIKVLIIICIIIISLLLLLITKNMNKEEKVVLSEEQMGLKEFPTNVSEQLIYSEWLQINQVINQYLNIINKNSNLYYTRDENNNYIRIKDETPIKENIYSLLSQYYIDKNKINIDNVYNYIDNVKSNQIYTILNIKKIVKSKYNYYVVQGFIEENENFKTVKNYIINFNLEEGIFSIEPINKDTDINEIQINEVQIMKNDYNEITPILANSENIIKEYFNTLKRLMLVYPEKAYEYLDREYRNLRFGTIDKFKEYVNDNKQAISSMYIQKYQKTQLDNYIRYICIDKRGKSYIFKEKSVLNYSVILDTYTIDLPEFIEKYNKANTMQRVGYNIAKCIEAINCKDYNYVYNKLDEDFKNNRYKTLLEFKQSIENNLFEDNEIEVVSNTNEGNICIYKLKVINSQDNTKYKNMTVIMKLKEGTDFIMSFSFE